MNRTGLLIALAIAAITGVVFGLYPDLDLRIARFFYSFEDVTHNKFAFRIYPPVLWARDIGLWIGTLLVTPAVVSLVIKLVLPRRKLLISGRAIVFLMATMALAPGLLVNVVLKDHWGRSRPIDVTQFGGSERFVAWWDHVAIAPRIAPLFPVMWRVRFGQSRLRLSHHHNGVLLPMAQHLRLAPAWPRSA